MEGYNNNNNFNSSGAPGGALDVISTPGPGVYRGEEKETHKQSVVGKKWYPRGAWDNRNHRFSSYSVYSVRRDEEKETQT